MTPMRRAIRLLLEAPALATRVTDPAGLAASGLPGADLLAALIAYFQAEPAATVARALEHWRDTDEGRVLARLAGQPLTTPAEGLEAEFDGLLANFARSRREQRLQALLAKGLKALSAEEKAELSALQRRG